eukprot:1869849-Rhodomonas_salina.1
MVWWHGICSTAGLEYGGIGWLVLRKGTLVRAQLVLRLGMFVPGSGCVVLRLGIFVPGVQHRVHEERDPYQGG